LNLKKIFNSPALNSFKKIIKKRKVWVLLGLVLLLAGFLRLYKIGQQSFIADEFLGINASYGYQQTGEWKLWDFNQERLTDEAYTRANVYYWQVAQVLDWLGLGEGNARLVSVAWGLLGILAVFGAVYYFTSNWILAIVAALLLAISPTALIFDRKLRMYSMFAPVFFLLSLSIFLFLEKSFLLKKNFWEKIKVKFFPPTGLNWVFLPFVFLLGMLSLTTHLLTVNIFPIVLVYLLIMAVREYWQKKKLLNRYSLYSGGMVLLVLLALQNPQIRVSLNFFSLVSNWSYFEKAVFDYSHPVLAVGFLLLGGWYLIKNYSKFGLWIATNFLVILLLAAFVWKRNAGLQYLYFITPFKAILLAGGLFFLVDFLVDKLFSGSRKALWLLAGFLFLLLPNWGYFLSKEGFYQNIKKWDNPNYREVYGYYVKNKKGNSAIIARPLSFYYLNKTQSPVIEYGVDNPLTLERVLLAQGQFDELWIIFSKDTYIKNEAEKYIKENFEPIKTNYTNDTLLIYVWRKSGLANKSSLEEKNDPKYFSQNSEIKEPSGIVFDPKRKNFFVVGDGGSLYQLDTRAS